MGLETFDIICSAIQLMEPGNTKQVRKDVITDVTTLIKALDKLTVDSTLIQALIRVYYSSVAVVLNMDVSILPYAVKESIIESLENIKNALAKEIFNTTKYVDVDNKNEVKYMREIVRCVYGSDMIC